MPHEATICVYTKKALEHVLDPRNAGEVADPHGTGQVVDPSCGDVIRITIRVEGDRIADARFFASGCPAATAMGSATAELAKGRTLEEAVAITGLEVSAELGALPAEELHCSGVAAGALRASIRDYARHAGARSVRNCKEIGK